MIGLLIGLMLATGMALFLEYLDDTIKDAEEARRVIGAPVLGTIPFIHSDDSRPGNRTALSMISHLSPNRLFRSLPQPAHQTSTFRPSTARRRCCSPPAPFPGEGKTTISANLAITLSQTGARVLVIDGDLRRPSLHAKFGHSQVPGLSEILAGDVKANDILHDTGIPNLKLLTAGTTPPNPAELLGSEKMAELLSRPA